MKRMSPLSLLLAASLPLVLTLPVVAQGNGLLKDHSLEEAADKERPKGWYAFVTPKEVDSGLFYVTGGKEGETTHTGSSALQFHFPEGADIVQVVWNAHPGHHGIKAEPGTYTCSYWVKGEDLQEGFHAWISIIGYDAENERVDEIGRSEYQTAKTLTAGEWTNVTFSFEIPDDKKVVAFTPSAVFKTDPKSVANNMPASTRILVDDIVITRN